jgi:hypothetical protein
MKSQKIDPQRLIEIIRSEELFSLKLLATKLGVTEQHLIDFALSVYNQAMSENRERYKREFKEDNVDKYFNVEIFNTESISSAEDFLDFFKKIEKPYTETCIATLCRIAPTLIPFYRKELKGKIRKEELSNFLQQIPLINTFDYKNIDQSTLLEVDEGEYYVIRNHFFFDTIITYLVVPLFINTTLAFDKLDEGKGESFFLQSTIATKFLEILELIKSNQLYSTDLLEIVDTDPYFNGNSIEVNTMGLDLYYGMKLFALFHEYSHILLNHFNSAVSNFEVEMEADIFAINALVVNTIDYFGEFKGVSEFKSVFPALRIISPLLYYLLKISISDNLLNTTPSYFIRFMNAQKIIEMQLKLIKGPSIGFDLITKINGIIDEVLKQKQVQTDAVISRLEAELKIVSERVKPFVFYEG